MYDEKCAMVVAFSPEDAAKFRDAVKDISTEIPYKPRPGESEDGTIVVLRFGHPKDYWDLLDKLDGIDYFIAWWDEDDWEDLSH